MLEVFIYHAFGECLACLGNPLVENFNVQGVYHQRKMYMYHNETILAVPIKKCICRYTLNQECIHILILQFFNVNQFYKHLQESTKTVLRIRESKLKFVQKKKKFPEICRGKSLLNILPSYTLCKNFKIHCQSTSQWNVHQIQKCTCMNAKSQKNTA